MDTLWVVRLLVVLTTWVASGHKLRRSVDTNNTLLSKDMAGGSNLSVQDRSVSNTVSIVGESVSNSMLASKLVRNSLCLHGRSVS